MTDRVVDVSHLPPGFQRSGWETRQFSGLGRIRLQSPLLTESHVAGLRRELRNGHRALSDRLWREIAHSVGTVAERLMTPGDPLRTSALADLKRTTPLSAEMTVAVLDGMARDWREDRLITMVEAEPHLARALDGLGPGPATMSLRARGVPFTVHIGSGSVPGVSGQSLIRALLVKSAVLVKPGAGDVALTAWLARGLAQVDPVLGSAVAVLYWPGSETPDALLRAADLVTIYGDNDTVQSVRSRVRATTRVVAYPHRLSLGAVAREVLLGDEATRTADAVASAVSMFDQRGCVSPHLVFVERGGVMDPTEWCELLSRSLAKTAERLPPGRWSTEEASAIQQLRGASELRALDGQPVRVSAGHDLGWTVVVDPGARLTAPCLGRTVTVRPVDDLSNLYEQLEPFEAVLQTVGFAGAPVRARTLAEALSAVGVTRVCGFEDQAFPPPWWMHDGQGPLAPLVRWTGVEGVG